MANSLSELRETELSSVDIGLPRVLVHAPYEWVHGRDVPKADFPPFHSAHAAVVQLGSQANTNRSRIASESQHGWG
jgi:hypothetical protein